MTRHYVFDVETLGPQETSVILSAAIVAIPDGDFTYQELLDSALFVKFNAKEQLQAGRTVDKDTVNWWKKQHEIPRRKSFDVNSEVEETFSQGLDSLRDYMLEYDKNSSFIWIRGTLDGTVMENACKHFNVPELFHWSRLRDIRTYIDVLAETSEMNGYCDTIKPYPMVVKHDPVHDVAYDCFMMRYYK